VQLNITSAQPITTEKPQNITRLAITKKLLITPIRPMATSHMQLITGPKLQSYMSRITEAINLVPWLMTSGRLLEGVRCCKNTAAFGSPFWFCFGSPMTAARNP